MQLERLLYSPPEGPFNENSGEENWSLRGVEELRWEGGVSSQFYQQSIYLCHAWEEVFSVSEPGPYV